MPNIQDHAISIGAQPFEMRPFDEIDSLILTQIVYMPMEGALGQGESTTIANLWRFLRETYPGGFEDPFQQKRYMLTEACANQPRYQDLVIHSHCHQIDPGREMQFGVCAFNLPGNQTYIAFQGTDWSLVGWKEDLNMSFMTVPSQLEAVAYTERIAAETGNILLIGGHSKGGNLAVYAGARVNGATRDQIQRIYCFDGPGVDEKTLNSQAYGLISERIQSYLPQSCVVGVLLNYHPIYTVVLSDSRGILQHDAMTWQVENGAFLTLPDLDFGGKLADEAINLWLKSMDTETRRTLVQTLHQILETSQGESLDGLILHWYESALRILDAVRDLDTDTRKNMRYLFSSLFGASAISALRNLLPGIRRSKNSEFGIGD